MPTYETGLPPAATPAPREQMHVHKIEYPSRCTGCEHLAAAFVSSAPDWMFIGRAPREDGWKELRREIEALPLSRHVVGYKEGMSRQPEKWPGWQIDPDPLTVEPPADPPPRKRGAGCSWLAAALTLGLLIVASSVVAAPSAAPEGAITSTAVPPVVLLGQRGAPDHGMGASPVMLAGTPQGEASSFVVAAPALRQGTLSYVDAKYGSDYLALPEPRGTVATICAARCITRRSNDFGPDQRVHPGRVADLSAADFVYVCQKPLSAGLCVGTVEIDPPVHVDDDRMRSEDGPAPTVPPTDTLRAVQ